MTEWNVKSKEVLLKWIMFCRADGSQGKRVQLYVMDLNSANGTFVNNNKIESQKYVQLLEKVRKMLFLIFFYCETES